MSTTGRRGINIPKYHANQNHGNSHPLGWITPIWGKTTFMVVPRKSHPSRGWMPPYGGGPPLWWYHGRTQTTFMVVPEFPPLAGVDAPHVGEDHLYGGTTENPTPRGWMPPMWGKTTFMVVPNQKRPIRYMPAAHIRWVVMRGRSPHPVGGDTTVKHKALRHTLHYGNYRQIG